MADRSKRGRRHQQRNGGGPIRVVGGLDTLSPEPILAPDRAPDIAPTRSDRDLITTLTDWGIEPWEIALATGQSEALVEAVLLDEGKARSARPRAPWADDFLIFLHARLTDLPNWWEFSAAQNPSVSGDRLPHGQRKRARETRAL